MIDQSNDFKGKKDQWEMHFQLREKSVFILIHSQQTMESYEAEMTSEMMAQDKNFSFFFDNVKDLYKFLEASYTQLSINRDGCIMFVMGMPVGKIVKNIEFKIPTSKRQVDQNMIFEKKIKTLQKNFQALKQQNVELSAQSKAQQLAITKLKEDFAGLQKTLAQKDEVLNSIFSQLSEIGKWREEKQKGFFQIMKTKSKFVADEMNSHNIKFINSGNRYKKNCGGSWDVLISKYEIQKNEIHRCIIKQIKAGNNGSFMYGIGTASIRGINRAQDHKQYVGYYENTGNVYDKGESKKGGNKIKDGETITIQVDTRNWKIVWYVEGNKQAETAITGQLRLKPIYIAIIVYNDESQIEFI